MAFKIQKQIYAHEKGGLTAGIANMWPETRNLFANQDRMLRALDTFAEEGVNLALFPEYTMSGAFGDHGDSAIYMGQANLEQMMPWLETRVAPYINDTLQYIVVNGPVPDGKGRFFNTTLVVDRSGPTLTPDRTYIKTFLPGSEKKHIQSGVEDSLVMETPYGCLGFLTCYDICFSQILTDLVYTHNIDILVVPAAWRRQGERVYSGMKIREENFYQLQWEMLLPALATQHQIWIMAANGVGPHAKSDTDYCGRSGVWAPSGINMILGSDREEELLILKNINVQAALDMERASFGCVSDYREIVAARQQKLNEIE